MQKETVHKERNEKEVMKKKHVSYFWSCCVVCVLLRCFQATQRI